MVLKNLKIKVANLEESKIVQEWAFEQGYKWFNGCKLQELDKKFLFLYVNSRITFSNYYDAFVFHKNKEIFISDIINQNSNEEIWF